MNIIRCQPLDLSSNWMDDEMVEGISELLFKDNGFLEAINLNYNGFSIEGRQYLLKRFLEGNNNTLTNLDVESDNSQTDFDAKTDLELLNAVERKLQMNRMNKVIAVWPKSYESPKYRDVSFNFPHEITLSRQQ